MWNVTSSSLYCVRSHRTLAIVVCKSSWEITQLPSSLVDFVRRVKIYILQKKRLLFPVRKQYSTTPYCCWAQRKTGIDDLFSYCMWNLFYCILLSSMYCITINIIYCIETYVKISNLLEAYTVWKRACVCEYITSKHNMCTVCVWMLRT